uniref:3-oxosteroid 1-dehydrogenase n=1 Tax=Rhodococcus opacus TaxID=37919 RepID=3O1D_RHOOP|nr:RecName: Full=3-oxosteroid 1-dehydrogenase; AltName: Full=Steroid 1:2-dehydrogenase [Rhodococcus opacus]AAB02831.1 3-oxosteroid delta(1)-dehydrogenase [Rhodococcus opacus]
MQDWTSECDLLVVGSGGGALTGAYTAAAQGLTTIVLEKTDRFGGTSAYSGASIWLPGTQVQERAGLPDSTENARSYLRALLGDAESERQDAYVETAPAVVALLEQNPNIEFEFRAFPDYYKAEGRMDTGRSINPLDLDPADIGDLAGRCVRNCTKTDRMDHAPGRMIGGRALIAVSAAVQSTARQNFAPESVLTSLIVEDGRVVGGLRSNPRYRQRIKANRGVLMHAGGGFEGNAEMREQAGTPGKAIWSMGPSGPTPATRSPPELAGRRRNSLARSGVVLPRGRAARRRRLHGRVRGGLVVDSPGSVPQRVASVRPVRTSHGCSPDDNGSAVPSFMIFDSREVTDCPPSASRTRPPPSTSKPEPGSVPTLSKNSLPRPDYRPERIAQHCRKVQRCRKLGVDEEFHRGEDPYDAFFCPPNGGANAALTAIENGPFYAARDRLSDLGTKGGLVTDVNGRVLRADGSAIDGLYAAGNTSASVAPFYPGPGVPLGTAMVFSYRAAQDMAK